MKHKLTERTINSLPTTGKRYDVRFEGQAVKGLILRVGASGSKTWTFVQKIPDRKELHCATFGKIELDAHDKIRPSNLDKVLVWAAKQRKAVRKSKSKVEAKREAQGPMLLDQLYEQYVKEHSKLKKRLSSQEDDERVWRIHIQPEFGGHKVKKISHPEVASFISHKEIELKAKGGSGGRVNNILALLSSMMNFACKRRYIKTNPCFGISKLKSEHSWPELSDTQRHSLREAAYEESRMMGLIIDMALVTGARKQEILKARWEEIRGDVWTIPIERKKGKKEHVLTLPPSLHEALMTWKHRDGVIDENGSVAPLVRNTGFLFPSNGVKFKGKFNGKTGTYEDVVPEILRPAIGDIKGPWTRIRKKVGLERFRFHDLRHDFGTQSAKAGVDVYALMNAMGHQRIETTMLYINKAGLDGHRTVLAERERAIFKSEINISF